MRQLLEFQGRLRPIEAVALTFMRNHGRITAMQDVFHYIQLGTYWLKSAADCLYLAQMEDDVVHPKQEGDTIVPPEVPKEVDSNETKQVMFMFICLEELEKDMFAFIKDVGMDEEPKFWVKHSLEKIINAKFSLVIAGLQYERLQSIGGTNSLST
jgi:hypothetical protein